MPRAPSLVVGTNKILHTLKQGIYLTVPLLLIWLTFNSLASASLIGEEFNSTQSFVKGAVVSIDQSNPKDITLSTLANSEYLLGTVVNSTDSLVSFSKNNSSVSVALNGEAQVLVSNANGNVAKGDFIGASWLEGVAMKSLDTDKQKLLGVAMEDLNLSEAKDYGSIKTSQGDKSISVGYLKVRLFNKEGIRSTIVQNTGIEGVLSSIAGKDVSFAKVLVGLAIFLMSIIVSGFFVSSSIKGSFVSIGRNPMASDSIYRSLLHVSMVSVVVIVIGTALAYVVLVI